MKTPQTSQSFKEKYGPWAVVAGASEGLGAAFAQALALQGLNLVLVARRTEPLEKLARQLSGRYGIETRPLSLDLAERGSVEALSRETAGLVVGMLVYNAAHSAIGLFEQQPAEVHQREIDTNVSAPMQLVYHFGQPMLERGRGGIVLMSSLSAFQGTAYIANYTATKAYNFVLAEGLWEEWRGRGVDILACLAGAVRTPGYVESAPKRSGGLADMSMAPDAVVEGALGALGRRPTVIPGGMNRVSSFVMRRILSRSAAIRLMGSVLRGMYAKDGSAKEEI